MDNGQKLPNIIRTFYRTEMEHAIARLQVYRLVFHWSWISTAGSIYSPRVCPYLHGQGQHRVVSVVRRVLHLFYCLLRLSRNMSYILSGTSIPNKAMPFFRIFATFLANIRRTAFFCSSGSLRIEKS